MHSISQKMVSLACNNLQIDRRVLKRKWSRYPKSKYAKLIIAHILYCNTNMSYKQISKQFNIGYSRIRYCVKECSTILSDLNSDYEKYYKLYPGFLQAYQTMKQQFDNIKNNSYG